MSVITISRDVKCGGREVAAYLAQKLGYTCLQHREVITDCAKKYNIVEEDLVSRLEETPGIWQRLTRTHYRDLIYVQSAVLEAVKQDNVVYHGLAGQLFLSGVGHVLKLRLVAPFESRINLAMREMKIDRDEAVKFLNATDEKRSRWFKIVYGEDQNRLSLYDLSVNRQNMSNEALGNIVTAAVTSEGFRTTRRRTEELENLSKACEVRAAFASDDKLWDPAVSVTANGSIVTLSGLVENEKIRDALIEIAKQVKGVTDCESRLSLRSSGLSGKTAWKD